jgi:hypothetical protein
MNLRNIGGNFSKFRSYYLDPLCKKSLEFSGILEEFSEFEVY